MVETKDGTCSPPLALATEQRIPEINNDNTIVTTKFQLVDL